MSQYAVFLASLLFASMAFGQTIFEPVRYQYGTAAKVYYGGTDPATMEALDKDAASLRTEGLPCYRSFGYLPGPAPLYPDFGVKVDGRAPVYFHDPCGTMDMTSTPDDARTQAYSSVPRFFRMADLAATARQTPDGQRVIPAAPPAHTAEARIEIKPYARPAPSTRPANDPTPILIIPKKALEPAKPGLPVASTR